MTIKRPGLLERFMEWVVTHPIRAAVVVGGLITGFQLLVRYVSGHVPVVLYLLYLVPFIPPYFVSRTAKRITERSAQHDFISDAEPYIFVAYPDEATVEGLLTSRPEIVSDSIERHLHCPAARLLDDVVMPPQFLDNEEDRTTIARELVNDMLRHGDRGVLINFKVRLKPIGANAAVPYLMNSVLKLSGGRLKWQGTLMNDEHRGGTAE